MSNFFSDLFDSLGQIDRYCHLSSEIMSKSFVTFYEKCAAVKITLQLLFFVTAKLIAWHAKTAINNLFKTIFRIKMLYTEAEIYRFFKEQLTWYTLYVLGYMLWNNSFYVPEILCSSNFMFLCHALIFVFQRWF